MLLPISPFSSPALLMPGGSLSDEKRAHPELSGAPFTDDPRLISWKMRRGLWDRPLVVAKGKMTNAMRSFTSFPLRCNQRK